MCVNYKSAFYTNHTIKRQADFYRSLAEQESLSLDCMIGIKSTFVINTQLMNYIITTDNLSVTSLIKMDKLARMNTTSSMKIKAQKIGRCVIWILKLMLFCKKPKSKVVKT